MELHVVTGEMIRWDLPATTPESRRGWRRCTGPAAAQRGHATWATARESSACLGSWGSSLKILAVDGRSCFRLSLDGAVECLPGIEPGPLWSPIGNQNKGPVGALDFAGINRRSLSVRVGGIDGWDIAQVGDLAGEPDWPPVKRRGARVLVGGQGGRNPGQSACVPLARDDAADSRPRLLQRIESDAFFSQGTWIARVTTTLHWPRSRPGNSGAYTGPTAVLPFSHRCSDRVGRSSSPVRSRGAAPAGSARYDAGMWGSSGVIVVLESHSQADEGAAFGVLRFAVLRAVGATADPSATDGVPMRATWRAHWVEGRGRARELRRIPW